METPGVTRLTADPRCSRIVSFRLSREEYESLEAACTVHRIPHISELVRFAVQHRIEELSSPPIETELQQVESRIEVLAAELDRLQYLVHLQMALSPEEALLQSK
jgi:hypothetical protein